MQKLLALIGIVFASITDLKNANKALQSNLETAHKQIGELTAENAQLRRAAAGIDPNLVRAAEDKEAQAEAIVDEIRLKNTALQSALDDLHTQVDGAVTDVQSHVNDLQAESHSDIQTDSIAEPGNESSSASAESGSTTSSSTQTAPVDATAALVGGIEGRKGVDPEEADISGGIH